jgi:hypothetical protein
MSTSRVLVDWSVVTAEEYALAVLPWPVSVPLERACAWLLQHQDVQTREEAREIYARLVKRGVAVWRRDGADIQCAEASQKEALSYQSRVLESMVAELRNDRS